jgi:hypothetical protein
MANRTSEIWDRLLGLYGSGLIRKFGKAPPPEWDNLLAQLSDEQLRHGLAELVKSGRALPPSLPEFLALCRSAREWSAPIPTSVQIEGQRFDNWDIAANQHLFAEILRVANKRQHYTPEATMILVEWKNAWARDCRDHDEGDGVPLEKQKLWWQDCMDRAREMGAVAIK